VEEEAELAKAILHASIINYYEMLTGDYVSDWVLVSHRHNTDMAREQSSAVGVLTPTEQSFVTTRGLISIALDVDSLTAEEEA
jgi:hypothetical protein